MCSTRHASLPWRSVRPRDFVQGDFDIMSILSTRGKNAENWIKLAYRYKNIGFIHDNLLKIGSGWTMVLDFDDISGIGRKF